MSLYDQFGMDHDVEVGGVLIDYGRDGRIRVARAGGSNDRFIKALDAFQSKYERQINFKMLDDEVAERELSKIYAMTIITGWESGPDENPIQGIIPGPDGKDLKFNVKNATKLLRDLPDLFSDIRTQSTKLDLFKKMKIDRDVGNSATSLTTG